MSNRGAGSASERLSLLQRELARIASGFEAVVGASFYHVETGLQVSLNGDELFPMASTLKIPVAVHALSLVDQGILSFDQVVTLQASDIYRPTWGPICTFFSSGSVLTVRDLIALMLMDSDNNATDVVYRLTGGVTAVKERMRSYGLKCLSNDRRISVLLSNLFDRADITEETGISTEEFRRIVPDVAAGEWGAWAGEEAQKRLRQIERSETRDATTPLEMVALLVKIWRGELLRPATRLVLLELMYACVTGAARLKGILPSGTRVAHKTGTLLFAAHDVGIIDLPEDAGHLVSAVYTKDSRVASLEKRDRAIAQLSRAAYDYFVFLAE